MSLFFGGGGGKKPRYTGLQLQSSSSVLPVPVGWGMQRFAPNLIWYGDFKSKKKKVKAGKGGPKQTEYTYSASIIQALCEGVVSGIDRAWKDDERSTLAALGFSLFTGTIPQAPWGYMTSNHPSEALGYSGTAYVAVANYDLGNQASLPNHSFEVRLPLYDTGYAGTGDADCALIVEDMLTNANYGVNFPSSSIDSTTLLSGPDATTTGDSAYQTYCRVMGFGMSPILSDSSDASAILDRWMKITNSEVVWTGYALKFVPYAYDTITGNGAVFVPDTAPRYTLTDADFISKGVDPVEGSRVDPADAHNRLVIDIRERENEYNGLPVEWKDQALIDVYGLRPASNFKADEVCDVPMATKVVALMGKRNAYLRNEYTFTLGAEYVLLEPMDVVEIVDVKLGTFLVQIKEIEEDDNDQFKITAREISSTVSTSTGASQEPIGSVPQNTGADPGDVNTPLIFEPPADLSGGTPEVWAAVSGGDDTDANNVWGGCFVFVSADAGVTYQAIGQVESPARQGKLTANYAAYMGANPDSTNVLRVSLRMSNGELQSVSSTEAEDAATLCVIEDAGGTLEYVSFEDAALTGANAYNLTDVWRGYYRTTMGAHLSNAQFARLDENIFRYALPREYVGIPLKFKFQSYNIWSLGAQDISGLTEYNYTPSGEGFKIAPPGTPTLTFAARTQADGTNIIRGTVTLSTPSAGPYLDHYDVETTIDAGVTWVSVGTIPAGGTLLDFEPAVASTNYRARVRAVSKVTEGDPSAWVQSSIVNSGALSQAAPGVPLNLTITAQVYANFLEWDPPVTGGTPTEYRVYAVQDPVGSFGSAILVGTSQSTTFTHSGLGGGATWRYWVTAYNFAGESTTLGPVNSTALSATQPFGFSYTRSVAGMTLNSDIMGFDPGIAWSMPINLPNSQGNVTTAPSAQTDFDLRLNGVSIGTIRFAASSVVATFIKAATTVSNIGDRVTIHSPASLNGMTGILDISILGSR